jgi:hypothetical protein
VGKVKSPETLTDLVRLADVQSWPQLSGENQRAVVNCIHNAIMQKFRQSGRRPIMGASALSTVKEGRPSMSVLDEVGVQLGGLQQKMIVLSGRLKGLPRSSTRNRLIDDQRRLGNLIEYYINAQIAIREFQEKRRV